MTFENDAFQHRDFQTGETQCSPISSTRSSGNTTSEIRDDNEPSSVGLVSIDNRRKIGSINKEFFLMWNLTESVVTPWCWQQVLRFIIEQLENPQSLLIDIRNIKEQKTLETQGTVQLRDGRSFSYSSEPQWSKGRVVGRIYIFHLL